MDAEPSARVNVAGNPSTPIETLVALTADPDPDVRRAVAMNEATPAEVLSRLVDDPDPGVRGLLPLRDLRPQDLDRLCADEHPTIRRLAREVRAVRQPAPAPMSPAAPAVTTPPPLPMKPPSPIVPGPPPAMPLAVVSPAPVAAPRGNPRGLAALLDRIGPLPRVIVAILGAVLAGIVALTLVALVSGEGSAFEGGVVVAILVATLLAIVYGVARAVHRPPPPPDGDRELYHPDDLR